MHSLLMTSLNTWRSGTRCDGVEYTVTECNCTRQKAFPVASIIRHHVVFDIPSRRSSHLTYKSPMFIYHGGITIWNSGVVEHVVTEWNIQWMSATSWRHEAMETWRHGDMETWRHGGMETWRHGDMETWRHGDMDTWIHEYMKTWIHGDMESWRHGDMETWIHGDMEIHHMIDKLDATCEQYGMAMNAKKTKQWS